MDYKALFEPDEEMGGFVVTFPDFEWGVTQGDTLEHAEAMASDALAMVIGHYIGRGMPLPEAGRYRGRKYRPVHLTAMQTMKAELYRAFLGSGIRKSELARRLGIPKTNVDRLFDFRHGSRIDQLEAAFKAVGMRLGVLVEAA